LCFSFDIFDTSMMNAFISITKVGGYILLFSIVLSLGKALPFAPFLAILEVTNGIPLILRTVQNSDIAYILTLTLTSFGGICTLAQTRAMLSGTRLSISAHTIEKLITALVTSLLALLFIRL
ncbi:MAG: transporter, partial [Faecalimonas sp.]|nr:transporter [Faecalimonas sp.]